MEENSRERTEARQRYNELLRELRTIIPGVQVLFGFLLTVPFSTRFDRITEGSKVMFVISLMAAAVATICLLGSAAYHRVAGRPERKRRLHYGMRLSLAGMAFLAISVSCALFVVGPIPVQQRSHGVGPIHFQRRALNTHLVSNTLAGALAESASRSASLPYHYR